MKGSKILISQPAPSQSNPYADLISKYDLTIDFYQFFKIAPLNSKEFRQQKISILDHTAVVFTSKVTIDAFFMLCEELRVAIPETMKYFCISEAIALYLQKHIVYRKRKIFFGTGTTESIFEAIGSKHKAETFLIATADNSKPEIVKLFSKAGLKYSSALFAKTIFADLSHLDIKSYNIIAFYSPSDVKSLFESYPEFEQGDTKFLTFGTTTAKALKAAKLKVSVAAPTPEVPSIAKAIQIHCEK